MKKENKNDKNITAMINKNDYGSYEAPEAIVFSVRTEDCIMSLSDGNPDINGDDVVDDSDGWGN